MTSAEKPVGTGGFLHPESIVEEFGIKDGMQIADFGCGAGYFTILMAEKTGPTGKVYALDVQESALDNVITKARAGNVNNIETIRTNLEILGGSSLADNSQDSVMLHNILFQSKKRQEIVHEAKRILKTGGTIVVIEWAKSVGGFGPPDDLCLDPDEIKDIAQKENLSLERGFDAGRFHFGFIFIKK